ncbi:hypothetical protein F5B20DRAFT_573487 [Whalleya microplaca]|nr:hypothetical protein F5B20DRAFT_573487 [Whalleya microplaca]
MATLYSLPGLDDVPETENPKHALLLDRVMEGQPLASHSRLLQLPSELLAVIIDFLTDDIEALSSLALVNSDCRQWARSRQFAEVCWAGRYGTQGLLRKVFEESISRKGSLKEPTIGACIRKFTLAGDWIEGWVEEWDREIHDCTRREFLSCYDKECRDELLMQDGDNYALWRLIALEAISQGMPNLQDSFRSIVQSPAQQVKLKGAVTNEFILAGFSQPLNTRSVWPLRSLTLSIKLEKRAGEGVHDNIYNFPFTNHALSQFFDRILRLCAPTLESLALATRELYYSHKKIGQFDVNYPWLHHIQLTYSGFLSILNAPLRHLSISPGFHENLVTLGKALPNCKLLRDLETLVLDLREVSEQDATLLADFMGRHQHVKNLCVHHKLTDASDDGDHLRSRITQALSSRGFTSLRTLSLTWGRGSIDESTDMHIAHNQRDLLAVVGKITTLQQLSLQYHDIWGSYGWLIDHDEMRTSLRPLKQLKKLAFGQDIYPVREVRPFSPIGLYVQVSDSDRIDAEARPELDDASENLLELDDDKLWARAHRNRMLAQAEKYAAILPSLEWMLCGQEPMLIQGNTSNTDLKVAMPASKAEIWWGLVPGAYNWQWR